MKRNVIGGEGDVADELEKIVKGAKHAHWSRQSGVRSALSAIVCRVSCSFQSRRGILALFCMSK